MYFLSITVLCFLFQQTFGRPSRVLQDYDKYSKENSYRDDDSSNSDDYLHREQKSSLKQFTGNEPAPKLELQDENVSNTNEVDHAQPDKDYLENNNGDQADTAHSSQDMSMGNDVKRTVTYGNGNILFHDNYQKSRKGESNEDNEEDKVEPSQYTRYLKQFNAFHNVDGDAVNRDRRQLKNDNFNELIGNDEISTQKNELSASEDEETAIRRHVKKLSKEEFNELLHSLSEDKRALLKNIIDSSQQGYDGINKREITKKAGANEENSLVGNEQSDTSKIQGGSANLEGESSISPGFEKQDSTKKTESESMYSKSTEIANSSEKSNEKVNVLDTISDNKLVKSDNMENLESAETESKVLGSSDSEKETSKKGSKREINTKSNNQRELIIEEPAVLSSSNKEDFYCSDNEEISQLWNEESNLYEDNKHKRETCPNDFDSIKSLEESFPNADNINNVKPGSDMVPLVRVKRNDLDKVIAKRDSNVPSNLKVPYFSSVLEDNEDGSDEGGEFQDDGFFDRSANFAKSGEIPKQGTDDSKDGGENDIKYCGNSQPSQMDKSKLETDTVGLGSDTDIVLSGIEGVDDNMMYNSVARIRRTGNAFDNLNMEGETSKRKLENKQQLDSQTEDNEIGEEARYQENDAFGSLPQNYEQDLGRFKRIRRLKTRK